MMRNPEEERRKALLECLEECGLDGNRLELAEKYLNEEIEVCDLKLEEKEVYLDSTRPERSQRLEKCFQRLYSHKETEVARRFFDLLFQIFGVNLSQLYFRLYWLHKSIPADVRIAIEATFYGNAGMGRTGIYKTLYATSEDREIFVKAMTYTDKKYLNSDFPILTALFYNGSDGLWDGKAVWEHESAGNGVLQAIAGLLGAGRDAAGHFETNQYVQRYQKEFVRYTAMFPGVFNAVFGNSFTEEEMGRIKNYILQGEVAGPVPGDIVSLLSGKNLNENSLKTFVSMAVANYRLSPVIFRFLKACLCCPQMERVLDVMYSVPCRKNMGRELIRWRLDFSLDDQRFIRWLGNRRTGQDARGGEASPAEKALREMTKLAPLSYLEAYKTAQTLIQDRLVEAAKQGRDPLFYKQKLLPLLGNDKQNYQQKILEQIVPSEDAQLQALSKDFLNGAVEIGALYPQEAKLQGRSYANISAPLLSYLRVYGQDDFYERAAAYLGLRCMEYTLSAFCRKENSFSAEQMKAFFAAMKRGGLDILHRLKVGAVIYDSYTGNSVDKRKVLEEVFGQELKENREETLRGFQMAPVSCRIIGVALLARDWTENRRELFAYLGESSKQVKEELVKVYAAHEESLPELLEVLKNSKKSAEREMAAAVLGKYRGISAHLTELAEICEKEKSKKVADLIREILRANGAAAAGAGETSDGGNRNASGKLTAQDYVRECHKGGKKRTLAWITEGYAEAMPAVHTLVITPGQDGEKREIGEAASEEYLQAILLSYSSMPTPGVCPEVRLLTEGVDQRELAGFMDVVYERFLEKGAEAKKKWVLYAAAIHGGRGIVAKLKAKIDDWAEHSRGAMAAEAVKALTLNEDPMALLTVDGIARKYKFKQVRKAAQDAMAYAAEQLGLTVEELADRIVPDLGFDEKMERRFDYGARSFIVRISPDLELEVRDESGKKLKSLPAVGKSDDATKAEAALSEFKELKKQMKATVKNQALRLELALSLDRRWTVENWKRLFVKNPVMHQFAISLIWGYYEKDVLQQTFRYMEDGTFNTAEEEEYDLTGEGYVGLMHPVEMDAETIAAWKEQLSDYEITQAVEQLGRPVFRISEEEKGLRHLERFGGKILNGLSLAGKMTGLGWSKGTPEDAGIYYSYDRWDADAGLGAVLCFSGAYIGDENDEVTVYYASVYSIKDRGSIGWRYDIKKDEKAICLDKVPQRYLSELIYQLTKATASSTETDEHWKEDVR